MVMQDTMDAAMCERHSGAQPGGGICAVCLQEKLVLLWRGEGNSNRDKEEFSITPPLGHGNCRTPPPACDPCATTDAPHVYRSAVSACFPLVFRVRNLQRDDVHESSKSSKGLEREKIDRSCVSGFDAADGGGSGDGQHQFSCELKSIMKELAALHEKKKLEKCLKKRAGTTDQSGSGVEAATEVGQTPPHFGEWSQDPVAAASLETHVPKAKGSIHEDEDEEDEEDEDERYPKSTLCLWPGHLRAKLNLKWAKVLVNPIISSNKIAPSKSDLLSKTTVSVRPKAVVVEEAREQSGRDCETSGMLSMNNDVVKERTPSTGPQIMPSPAAPMLPPPYVHRASDEDGGAALEIDKETAMRMEASRIVVMSWLQSLPSPKAIHLKHRGLPDDLSLGNGVLEMCDEEEVTEFECQSVGESAMSDTKFESAHTSLPNMHRPLEPVDVHHHITSFGKFLRTSSQSFAPRQMVDIEIVAQ